jgi:hypothetical protein
LRSIRSEGCPVCMETIKSVPVYQCANGHVICKDCIEKLNNCPICRNDSELRRSLKLENIVQRLEGIKPENVGPLTPTPNLQKWGKGFVRSYGTINRPNQEPHIETPIPQTTTLHELVSQAAINQAAIRAIRQPSIRQPVVRQPSINGPNQVTRIGINPQANPRQSTPRQATPRQATPRQATPRQATPRQALSRQTSIGINPQANTRQATPRQALSRQTRRLARIQDARRESRIMINNQDVGSVMYPIINGPNQDVNLQSNPGQAEINPIIATIVIFIIVLIFAAFIAFCTCVVSSLEFCNCS